jgi:hypothetical protein
MIYVMLIKNHPNTSKNAGANYRFDPPAINVNHWTISSIPVKKTPAVLKPQILMPEQPTAYLKPKKYDFF